MSDWLLPLLLAVPLAGSVVLLLVPGLLSERYAVWFGVVVSAVTAAVFAVRHRITPVPARALNETLSRWFLPLRHAQCGRPSPLLVCAPPLIISRRHGGYGAFRRGR